MRKLLKCELHTRATWLRANIRKENENKYTVLTKPRNTTLRMRVIHICMVATFKNQLHNYCSRQKSSHIFPRRQREQIHSEFIWAADDALYN